MAADRTVQVSLTAQVTGYLQGMDKARKATENAGTAAEKAARQVEQQAQAMDAAGKGLLVVGTVAIAATALTVKAAIGWESAWAGVTKTVNGTPAELQKVEDGLRSLARTLPSSHDEIAAVAEAAGQLGIQTSSVVAFTNTMIDLGETTNLSADEAATSLARFMNIMGTSQHDVSNLGSAIVELGNNYATTEAEIVAMAMRLAGAGRQIGLSEGEVLGLSTALSSVGIEAEAGGSAFSTLMVNIASEVETGGDKLEGFAKASGLSAEEFSKQWKEDPAAALDSFISGLGNLDAAGGSTLQTLADLGITEIRMRDALLRASAARELFSGAMNTGNEAYEENNALAAEAALRYATVESKLEITKNQVIDAAISFGEVFLPAVSAASDAIGGIADALGDMGTPMQETVAVVGVLAGGVALAGGAFLLALPKIAAFQASLVVLSTSSMPAVAASATAMMGATTRATTAMASSARFMTGPWGIALAAGAIGVKLLSDYLGSLKATSEELENSMKTAKTAADMFRTAGEGIDLNTFADVTAQLNDLPALLQESADQSSSLFAKFNGAGTRGALNALKDIGTQLAATSATDLPEAQRQFGLLAAETDESDQSLWRLLNSMPDYKDALTAQASALDINVTSSDEAANKTALLKLAQEEAAPVALTAAEAYLETADQATALEDELLTLIGTMNQMNEIGQDASGANIDYQQSLADIDEQIRKVNEGAEGYVRTLDISTEAGRTNRGMLDDLAGSNQAAAAAQFELDGNTANYRTTLEAGHQAVYDRAIALGANADEANRIADEISKIPSEKEWEMIAITADANAKVTAFKALLASVPANQRTLIGVTSTFSSNAESLLKPPGAATGGTITGPGTGTSDSIPVMLSDGEEVTRALMAEKYRPLLKAINADRVDQYVGVQGYATGGTVGYATPVQYVQQGLGGGNTSVSVTPQIKVTVQSKGGIDLMKYVDVRIDQAEATHAGTMRRGLQK